MIWEQYWKTSIITQSLWQKPTINGLETIYCCFSNIPIQLGEGLASQQYLKLKN